MQFSRLLRGTLEEDAWGAPATGASCVSHFPVSTEPPGASQNRELATTQGLGMDFEVFFLLVEWSKPRTSRFVSCPELSQFAAPLPRTRRESLRLRSRRSYGRMRRGSAGGCFRRPRWLISWHRAMVCTESEVDMHSVRQIDLISEIYVFF